MSSGVGADISRRLHSMGRFMYHVKRTLVIHGCHESKMNFSLRQKQKLIAMNRIAICIPIYKRHDITNFVLSYYNKLKEDLKNEVELILLCCGSEGDISKQIAEDNNFIYIECKNEPLSQKQNALYQKAKEYNPDACIKVDSDSIISIDFFYHYNELINNEVDYGGITDIYFLTKKYFCYWGGYEDNRKGEATGVGRFMSRNLLTQLNWLPWGNLEINSRLDKNLTKSINSLPNFQNIKQNNISCNDINGMCVDLKSDFGISNFNDFKFSSIISVTDIDCDIDFNPILNNLIDYK